MRKILIAIAALVTLTSCRSIILEDRRECPKFVFFQVLNPENFHSYDRVYSTLFRYPDGMQVAADQPKLREIQDLSYYISVRKADAVKGYGLIGWQGLTQNGDDWLVPMGSQADTLYRYSYTADLDDESIIVPVEFSKEHSKVTIQFVGIESFTEAAGKFPFDILIRSNTSGINGFTGLPVRGDFEFKPTETTTGRFEFNILRQANADLTMELFGRPHLYPDEGFHRSFNLYRLIAENSNISWDEKNLPDIYIEIDYQQSDVYIQIDYWDEKTLHFDL